MKKFIVIAPANKTVVNFRGELIKRIINLGYEVKVIGPDKTYISEILNLGVSEFKHIPINRTGTNLFADFKYTYALWSYLRKEKPQAVLSYTIKPVIYGSIAAKLAGIRNITALITGIGYLFISTTLKTKVLKAIATTLYKIGLSCCNQVIFQNKDDYSQFASEKIVSQKKCAIVDGSGVDMTQFNPRPLPPEMTFLMVSRLLYNKGTMEYFRAAEIVKKEHPEVHFQILGQLDDKADCIQEEDLKPFITQKIIEQINETDDVRPFLENCSVFVLPSYREGVPRSVLEAMAIGRPILTTTAPGCKETVVEGENGFLVPVKDIPPLVEKMRWFINHPESLESMGKVSTKICRERFEITLINEKMISLMNLK